MRYFNAAGADEDGEIGECHEPETHLIPLVLQAALGKREAITVFGQDYPTPDGTCIRDYIHIQDLCRAHWMALEYLNEHQRSECFNLGNGNGFSVREVIEECREITGEKIQVIMGQRRDGDPAVLVANADFAKEVLGWVPEYKNLNTMISHAWQWEKSRYGS